MTPREARRKRRAAERRTKKAEIRRIKSDALPAPSAVSENGFVPQNHTQGNRAETNRANAQFSTGPKTPAGKSASSRNSTKHGLASSQIIIPGEDPAAFEALLADLLHEHQPANSTEEILVQQMAESHWLSQRALRLQNTCFTDTGVNEKSLALYLRYGTTHNRAFHKALSDLQRLQKERRKTDAGFVSHATGEPSLNEKFVPHKALEPGFVSQTDRTSLPETRQSAKQAA